MINGREDRVTNSGGPNVEDPFDIELIIHPEDLFAGDVLLYRPRKPNVIQSLIVQATSSPYTHAAIYLGDGQIAESNFPRGISVNALEPSFDGSEYVAVLRSQLNFSAERVGRLKVFVQAVMKEGRFYDLISVSRFSISSQNYFDHRLDFIRENYGLSQTTEEFAKTSFICSAFVVACYTVVGIIDETAQVAYRPEFFAPGHLPQDPTFGWLLGYLVPTGGSLRRDDPLLQQTTAWRDCQNVRWW